MYVPPPPNPPPLPPPPLDPNFFNWARVDRNDLNAERRHQQIFAELRWHRNVKYAILSLVIVLLTLVLMYNIALMEKVNAIHALSVCLFL